MTYDAGHPCCAEYGRLRREADCTRKALRLALGQLVRQEPTDSRAVSDEFVAMAAVEAGDMSPQVMQVIERAISRR